MELKDLKRDITQLPTDELMALLKDMRQSRRTPKKVHVDKPTASGKTLKAVSIGPSMETLMKSMSTEQLLEILQKAKKE